MAKQKLSDYQKLAQKIADEKGIKLKSAFRYLQRSKATGNKQKIVKPKFKGVSETIAKKAKSYVKKEKKKSEAKLPETPKVIKKSKQEVDFDDFDDDFIDNPLYGKNTGKRTLIEVDANFGYYGGKRKMRLSLSADEMKDLASAETISDALEVFANSRDGSFMSNPEITDFNSMKIK